MENKIKNQEKLYIQTLFALILIILLAVSAGCQSSSGYSIPSALQTTRNTPTAESDQSTSQSKGADAQPTEEPVLETPTPAPTATPGPLEIVVEDVSRSSGLTRVIILGVKGEDLVNIFISILIAILGVTIGLVVVKGANRLAERTPPRIDDTLVHILDEPLILSVSVYALSFATARLEILSPAVKQFLDLIYYAGYVVAATMVAWRVVDYSFKGALLRFSSPNNRSLLIAFTPLLQRTLQVLIIIAGLALVLENMGFNITALLAVLGLGGLAVSLAAKETLEDFINGIILLIDQPFKIGDRIKVESMDTWGDVEDIGTRTTQIRTLDNHLVVVPNSIMGNSQVENYSAPDPSFRMDLKLGVAYDSDIDQVIEIIEGAITGVEGIKQSEPPEVIFHEFGDSAIIFQVFYWLKSYRDISLRAKVNKAILEALDEAQIEMPFNTYDINLVNKPDNAAQPNK